MRGNVSDLRREMNSLRKQLDEARGLNGAQGFSQSQPIDNSIIPANYPIDVTPSRTSDIIQSHSDMLNSHPDLIHSRPEAQEVEAEEIKDFDNEEMSENESLNLSKLGRQMIEKALERNNGNRKKQPTNWESPTAPSIEESRNTGSEMINDSLLGKTIIKNKK